MTKAWEKWRKAHDPKYERRSTDADPYTLTWVWLPQVCHLSNKTIWPFRRAWRKRYFHFYNSRLAFTHWICQEEMLFAKLKGKI